MDAVDIVIGIGWAVWLRRRCSPLCGPGCSAGWTAGFNRIRYDADQTIAAFAARLKDAVDLNSVRDDLTGVVH